MKKNKYEPLVSIIIPVYNGANYMKEAIDSALNQTYKNIEIIVINDGSTDDGATEKIAKSYGKKIKYLAKENGGVSTALNLGIKKMKGEYFSWLSHDDRYYPEKIQTQIDYINENNLKDKKVILYCNYDVINENSEVINRVRFEVYKPNEKPENALLRGLVSGISLLIPKRAFEEVGLFDTKYRCIQDYLLFSEMMKTYQYIFTTECSSSTRIHSKQVTNSNPNIVKENNFLWVKMQENISDKRKIELEGSLYLFYKEMYNYLICNNKYLEAHNYTKQKMEENYLAEKKLVEKELKKISNSNLEKELLLDPNSKILNKFYNRLGKVETLNIIKKKSSHNIKKIITSMLNVEIEEEKRNTRNKIIEKIKFCLKKDGFFKSIIKGIKYLIRITKRRK